MSRRHGGLRSENRDDLSEISASAAKVVNDGKNPLLEFAMSYFREREKFSMVTSNDDSGKESTKKSKKQKKKKSSNVSKSDGGDWTWKDQVDMVKWTDSMINVGRTISLVNFMICMFIIFALSLRNRCFAWSLRM